MNQWVKKSIELANSPGYLDKLGDIYPVGETSSGRLTKEEKKSIKDAFRKEDRKELISVLLDLERFPIDEPYIGFLRVDSSAIDKNPKTIKRIGDKLIRMGLPKLLKGANRSKSPSRQFGQKFKEWLETGLKFPVLSDKDFLVYKGIAILKGSDSHLRDFAKKYLGYRRKKGLDLVVRVFDQFIVGEAKFISASGGTQHKSFRETIDFVKKKSKDRVHLIAVVDGVVWVSGSKKKSSKEKTLYETVKSLGENRVVLSSLLLKEYLISLR